VKNLQSLARKDWELRPAVVVAPGPSLTDEDVAVVRASRAADRVRVLSVSNAWKWTAGWADAYYAADRRYWRAYLHDMLKAGVQKDRIVTCCNMTAQADGVQYVKAANRPGLGHTYITTGGNSGWMAINLAFLYGARRIYLLGFDMQAGPSGESHADGDHVASCRIAMPFAEWVHRIEKAAPELKAAGCEVINLSRRTALTCFARGSIESFEATLLKPLLEKSWTA
jgi:hypothetical protein